VGHLGCTHGPDAAPPRTSSESQLSFKVPSSTFDPSSAQYTPGQVGPIVIDNGFGVGVSDASFKFTQ